MKKLFFGLCLSFFLVHQVNAQISTPAKRNFNIGLYFGPNFWLMKPQFAADVSYKFVNLRLMPYSNYNAAGLTFELAKLSNVFYNIYWTGSLYGGMGTDLNRYEVLPNSPDIVSEYTSLTAATGLKSYFATRCYSHLMLGVTQNTFVTPGRKTAAETYPYLEFGFGVHFWKNYPKLKPEETEE